MDMETLQLIIDAGPNAVEALKFYVLGQFGVATVITSGAFSTLYLLFKSIDKNTRENRYWDSLDPSTQKEFAMNFFKEKTK